jgi:hypothetical protein
MKTLGRATGGGFLVQLTAEEHEVLLELSDAVAGNTHPVSDQWDSGGVDCDLGGSLKGFRLWANLGYRLNGLKDAVGAAEKALGDKE